MGFFYRANTSQQRKLVPWTIQGRYIRRPWTNGVCYGENSLHNYEERICKKKMLAWRVVTILLLLSAVILQMLCDFKKDISRWLPYYFEDIFTIKTRVFKTYNYKWHENLLLVINNVLTPHPAPVLLNKFPWNFL